MAADAGPDGREGAALSETIFALSSGAPPAAVALIRISGPEADAALESLAGKLPEPRIATLARLRDGDEILDNALIIRFPGPASVTGDDVAELHLHGGRAVVSAILAALGRIQGLRPASPGEFTRRAFENGRVDLAEAEGLADLLEAETEVQRRQAVALAGGALGRQVAAWQEELLALSALVEAALDFSDEDDVASLPADFARRLAVLRESLTSWLARPPAERLKDGIRVVIAGPPNAGKSSLFNALVGRDAAIVTARPGTTRDLIEAPVAFDGIPFLLIDTAGLRDSADEAETIGVSRARASADAADLVLWLGQPGGAPAGAVKLHSKSDLGAAVTPADLSVSVTTSEGIDELTRLLVEKAKNILPKVGEVALNARHREALGIAEGALSEAESRSDALIVAESLRHARAALDRITGKAGVEDMLDGLFGRFCIGK